MTVRLKWLKMTAFKAFVKENTVVFPESGLVLIQGENTATNDPSGTGKSTILDAVAYALDICPYPATELQSWMTNTPMQVQLCLDSPAGEVVITRGKKSSIKIGDEEVTGAKAVTAKLRELFGVGSDILGPLTYRPQDQPGLFLSLDDSKKKEFLTQILGLTSFEDAIEVSEKAEKTLAMMLATLENKLNNSKQELEGVLSTAVPTMNNTESMYLERDRLEVEISDADAKLANLLQSTTEQKMAAGEDEQVTKLRQLQEVVGIQKQKALDDNRVRFQQHQAVQEVLRRKLQDITRQEQNVLTMRAELVKLRSQLVSMESGKCPTCSQSWVAAPTDTIRATIANYEAQLKAVVDFAGERQKTEMALREPFSQDPAIEELRTLQGQLDQQLENRLLELTREPMAVLREATNRINAEKATAQKQLSNLLELIRTAEESNRTMKAFVKSLEDRKARLQATVDSLQKEVDVTTAELNAERDFQHLLGREGFLGVIFDEVLAEIEAEANLRLAKLANVSHVTIQFKSETETSKGTTKRTITPIFNVGGHEAKLRSGLSGGMRTSVYGAVDLAVVSVVQRRTGSMPGFLFMDEAFNGQGNVTKEAAMEVLQEYGREKLVVVIDHSSELKEYFSQQIRVVQQDGESSIVQQGALS